MRFEWDEAKNEANRRKHGISFERAVLAFRDPFQISRFDRFENGEARFQTLGMVDNVKVILIVHVDRNEDGDERIRIISARAATKTERRDYEVENGQL